MGAVIFRAVRYAIQQRRGFLGEFSAPIACVEPMMDRNYSAQNQ